MATTISLPADFSAYPGGRVRLALIYDRLTEGFVGGMP